MAEKEIEVKEIKRRADAFELGEIATQTAMIIKDNSTEETMNVEQALVRILNKLDRLERGLL